VIEPIAELRESRVPELDQAEQEWLRAERDEQEWLRTEQVMSYGLVPARPGAAVRLQEMTGGY
jgi:hypothetical protein